MKRCTVIINDGSYINTPANRMVVQENMLYVYNDADLVALVEVSAIISAHISEKGEQNGRQ